MGPSKKNYKATKKFEKSHLKGVLDKRKATAKIKQRHQLKDRKKARRDRDAEFVKGPGPDGQERRKKKQDRQVSEMSVDGFFQDRSETLEQDGHKKGRASAPAAGTKRKRDEPEDGSKEQDDSANGQTEPFDGFEDADDDDDGDGQDSDLDMGMTRQAMDDLRDKDPEFYRFLKENDPDALDFDEDADLAEVDDLSEAEDGGGDGHDDAADKKQQQPKKKKRKTESENEKEAGARRTKGGTCILTQAMVAEWRRNMAKKRSLRAARQAVLAFRCAANLNRSAEEAKEEEEGRSGPPYQIDSPEVFNDVVVATLRELPAVIQSHLPTKESAAGRPYVATDSAKFKALANLLKSYTASAMRLLGTLSDAGTVGMTLGGLLPVLPYLVTFRKLLKALVKVAVAFWSTPGSAESTRVSAFLILRRLVVIGDRTLREVILKSAYQGLVQASRTTNANTIGPINLMKNSAAELWAIDDGVGYVTAFGFIRQLGIHLRNSIANNTHDAFRLVYNWQYVHSLDFWSRVLSEACSGDSSGRGGRGRGGDDDRQLRLLIYPLVQVTLGAARLIPSSTYFPLRFQLVRSLLRISRATGTYIPLAPVLLEVLDSAEMRRPAKSSTAKPLDFAVAYRAPQGLLRTRTYQDGVAEQVTELLGEFLVLWSTNVAFPELSLPVTVQLKRWLKLARRRSDGNRNQRAASGLALLVGKVEASATATERRRAAVDFTPRDRTKVEAFAHEMPWEKTPLGAYVVGRRARAEERARLVAEGERESESEEEAEEEEAEEEAEEDIEGE